MPTNYDIRFIFLSIYLLEKGLANHFNTLSFNTLEPHEQYEEAKR